MAAPTSTGINELNQFLIELAQRKAFGHVSFSLNAGQIQIVKFEEHFRPGELPIRDRARVDAAQPGKA